MIRQVETWKAFIVENQAHYNSNNELRFNLVELTPEERGWTELFQVYPPITSSGGSGTSPVNGRSYSWTYGFLPTGYFGVKNQSRVFTSSETWTCPEEVGEIYVKCVGRGAAGNSSNGGGGGGFIMAKINTVPGTSYAIIIDSAASSFGGVISALAANSSNGGSFTYTEDVEVLFKGSGGKGYDKGAGGGGGGGSELGTGGYACHGGGGGLHSGTTYNVSQGGCGMLGANADFGGAGFMSKVVSSGSYDGKGMFSNATGLKSNVNPYYNKLSVDITEDLGVWGTPNNYGGGGANSSGLMFSGGAMTSTQGYSGGFGGGGGGGGNRGSGTGSFYGGTGGYGGGGGMMYTDKTSTTSYGGNGGSGGGGGCADMHGSGRIGRAGTGGYGGGGGGPNGSGGAGLVIIEW